MHSGSLHTAATADGAQTTSSGKHPSSYKSRMNSLKTAHVSSNRTTPTLKVVRLSERSWKEVTHLVRYNFNHLGIGQCVCRRNKIPVHLHREVRNNSAWGRTFGHFLWIIWMNLISLPPSYKSKKKHVHIPSQLPCYSQHLYESGKHSQQPWHPLEGSSPANMRTDVHMSRHTYTYCPSLPTHTSPSNAKRFYLSFWCKDKDTTAE